MTGSDLGEISGHLFEAIPIVAGHNDAQGNYVPDELPPAPFNASAVSLGHFFFGTRF